MEPIEPFEPSWGSAGEWNQAYEKLENYLRALRVGSRLHRARLIHTILRRVADQVPPPTGESLSTLAMREAHATLDAWFTRILGTANTTGWSDVDGRVALLLSDALERWPYATLDTRHPPAELAAAMNRCLLRAGPDLQISRMVPRPLEFGLLSGLAGDALDSMQRRPLLKALLLWAFFLALLAVAFWHTR